ncbi:MAG: flagellar basal body P-ring formation chaperone FlgA [Pseudomonadota bacterium]|nr:flagellar basal body P-ring formation chaperone FlgA [Pseudomonadota bacterium]
MVKWVLAIALSQATMLVAASTPKHSHSDLGAIVAMALEDRARARGLENTHVEVFPVDSRVSLPRCADPVRLLGDRNQSVLGRVSVGVRCEAPEQWTIYLRAHVTSSVSVPVLRQPINRTDPINEDNVMLKDIQIDTDLRGIIVDPNQLFGKIAVRNLIAWEPLRHSDLKAPTLISRGQSVTITSEAGGLTVTMKGKALGNARAGDRLWVQNQSSKKRIEGVVTNEGKVLIQ